MNVFLYHLGMIWTIILRFAVNIQSGCLKSTRRNLWIFFLKLWILLGLKK